MQMLQPPDPSALLPPNFGAGWSSGVAAAAERIDRGPRELRERLAVLLLANPDPVNGVALAELYQRARGRHPLDHGDMRDKPVEKSAAPVAVEVESGVKTTAATVWVKRSRRRPAAACCAAEAGHHRRRRPRGLAAAPQHAAAYRSAAPPANPNDGRRPGDWIARAAARTSSRPSRRASAARVAPSPRQSRSTRTARRHRPPAASEAVSREPWRRAAGADADS